MDGSCIQYGMKMTLNIDDALLERVVAFTGAKSKTEAVDLALREMDRRALLIEVLNRDNAMSSEDWKNAFHPDYSAETARAAEEASTYGSKPRSRR